MSPPRIRKAGDSAMVLELDPVVDAATNARAIAIAAALRNERVAGVRDVVSTYRSVGVHFDPLMTDVDALERALRRVLDVPAGQVHGRSFDVPTLYGGEAGPDLASVAEWAGLSDEAAIDRHMRTTYRVFMIGFLPGFPYLGVVDERIAAPRRAAPRLRVPAGSVGIAGRQTGIYPQDSPGGWQIIGRTALRLFDPDRVPAALFQPGDTVRFVRDAARTLGESRAEPAGRPRASIARTRRTVTVVRPGMFTTIQDEGRWGHQAIGVPVSGALDRLAHRIANRAVGNTRDAATVEVTMAGPELRIEQEAQLAVAGADLEAGLDGAPVRPGTATHCRAGSVLRFGQRRAGARAYVAFDGGVAVEPVLGSRSTLARAALGGFEGRAVRAGDRLPLGTPRERGRSGGTHTAMVPMRGGARLRVLPGPQEELFPDVVWGAIERTRFIVTSRSDRMGYRLSGATLPVIGGAEMISDVAFAGGLQVPPSGEPILLMNDRQTTGGYPQVAIVITADLPIAGQLAPGDWVEFERCSRDEAIAALAAQEAMLGDR